jgi:hypothetical protein
LGVPQSFESLFFESGVGISVLPLCHLKPRTLPARNVLKKILRPLQVLPEGAHWSERPPHSFKILFKEGGVGTFVPLFFNLLKAIRAQMPQQQQAQSAPPSPIPEQQPQVDEMMRSA